MNYGMRSAYNRRTNKEFTVERKSGNAKIKGPTSPVHTDVLFEHPPSTALERSPGRESRSFSTKPNLRVQFLENFPGAEVVGRFQKANEKKNPWMNERGCRRDRSTGADQGTPGSSRRETGGRRKKVILETQIGQYVSGKTIEGQAHPSDYHVPPFLVAR